MTQNEMQTSLQPVNYHSLMPFNSGDVDIEGVDIQEYINILFRRRWLVLITIAVVLITGLLYTITRKPMYESTASIVVSTNTASSHGGNDDINLLNDLQALTNSRSVDTQVEIISSPDLIDEAYGRLPAEMKNKGFKSKTAPAWSLRVGNKKNTDIIFVTARAYDPKIAAAFANSIAETYFKRDLETNSQATRQAREYVEREMKTAEGNLAKANSMLASYKRETGLISIDSQLAKVSDYMAQLQIDRDSAKTELASAKRGVAKLSDELNSQNTSVVSSTTVAMNPQFSALVAQIDDLNSQRAKILQEFTPTSKEARKIDSEIQAAERRLKSVAKTIVAAKVEARNPVRDTLLTDYSTKVAAYAASEAKMNAIGVVLGERTRTFQALPEQERQLSDLLQKVTISSRTYDMLSTKYYALLINEQSALPNGMLISRARTPMAPSYPHRRKNAVLFLFLGTLLAAAAAIIAERLDVRIHDQATSEHLTRLPLLGVIPDLPDEEVARLQIGNLKHNNAFLESFRILRNNVTFSAIDNRMKVIAVTSPGRAAGKSTISMNLAIAMAMDGKRVVLVDCDLRRPSVHNWLNVKRDVGFTNVAKGLCTLDDALISTSTENLFCLVSGPLPPNPGEFLNSNRSRELFEDLSARFDTVIIDTPPVTGLSDVQIISTFVDGIIMVVTMNVTLKPYLQNAMRTLQQVEAPFIGYIANRMEMKRQGYGYYYNYYYYYDYDEESGDKTKVKHRRKSRKQLKGSD